LLTNTKYLLLPEKMQIGRSEQQKQARKKLLELKKKKLDTEGKLKTNYRKITGKNSQLVIKKKLRKKIMSNKNIKAPKECNLWQIFQIMPKKEK
jgi:hypothetical protein